MRVCFIDFAPWDYDVSSPALRPLGGSQSAMCYLAIEMAKAGHDVTVVTGTIKPPRMVRGVACHGLNPPRPPIPEGDFDAVVVLNAPVRGVGLREILPSSTRLVLWTQHTANQPAMRRLSQPEVRDAWDGIVCVSHWQKQDVLSRFDIGDDRISVIRNAIAPSFENLFASHADLVAAKSSDVLRIAYTSTPFRGLKLLPSIFREYRNLNPDAMLEVCSSMGVYMMGADQDRAMFRAIYDDVAATDGAELIGSLSQPHLAWRLRSAHILAYPNAFPETSCISVMEALAAGLRVVTSSLGALPETCEGFALLVPIDISIDDAKANIDVRHAADYERAFIQAMMQATYTTGGLYDQVAHMNQHHTWAARAQQWAAYLEKEIP